MSNPVTPWTAVYQASLSFTISWLLFKLMSFESVMPSNHLILCWSLFLLSSIFPSIRVFFLSWLFTSHGQSIGVSASVLPMNIHGWFPLELAGWISLPYKGLSRSSPVPQFESINSLALSILYGPILPSTYNYWKNHGFDYIDLCWQSDIFAF